MNRALLYLLVFLGSSSSGLSQISIENQLEAGVNSSGLTNIIRSRENTPVVSPIFGYWTKVKFRKRISYNLGVQYLIVGNKYHEHRDRVNDFHDYTTDEWTSILFQKISVPLIIGYDFKIKKTASTVYMGVKRNYFLNGKIEERFKYNDRNNPKNNSDNTYFDDPFAEGSFIRPASRRNKGVFLGCAVAISKKVNLNLNYSIFQYTSYSRGCLVFLYYNNDLALSLRYCIYSERK